MKTQDNTLVWSLNFLPLWCEILDQLHQISTIIQLLNISMSLWEHYIKGSSYHQSNYFIHYPNWTNDFLRWKWSWINHFGHVINQKRVGNYDNHLVHKFITPFIDKASTTRVPYQDHPFPHNPMNLRTWKMGAFVIDQSITGWWSSSKCMQLSTSNGTIAQQK